MAEAIEVERLRKCHYKALERIFTAEIEGRLPLQSKAAVFQELKNMGYAQHDSETLGRDRFGVVVISGWYLTHAGRLIYCMNCG